MKRLCLLLVVLSVVPLSVQAKMRAWGWCARGSVVVVTAGQSSTNKVMGSYPACQVTVYQTGTSTKATIYSDNSGTPLSNPFTANSLGYWEFYAANSLSLATRYDVQLSGGSIPTPFTLGDIILFDPQDGGGGGSSVTSVFGRTGDVIAQTNDYTFSQIGGVVQFSQGGTGLSSAPLNTVLVSTGSAWIARFMPDCQDTGGNHLNFTASTSLFNCGSSGSGGGASLPISGGGMTFDFLVPQVNGTGLGAAGHQPLTLAGSASVNGNIVLEPGQVVANSAVWIDAGRSDYPAFIVKQTNGNITTDVFRILNASGSTVFSITGSGVAPGAPGPNGLNVYGNITPQTDNAYYIGCTAASAGCSGNLRWKDIQTMTGTFSTSATFLGTSIYQDGAAKTLTIGSPVANYTNNWLMNWPVDKGTSNQVLAISSIVGSTVQLGWASLGNTVSWVEYIAAVCQNTTATLGFSSPVTNPASPVCVTGTNTQFGAAQFTATTQTLQGRFVLPDDWIAGAGNNLEFRFADVTDSNTGHAEVWNLQTACVSSFTASTDPSFNAAQTTSSSVSGTPNQTNMATLVTFTTTGCSAGNLMFFKIGLDSSRTATGNANLISIRFRIRRNI